MTRNAGSSQRPKPAPTSPAQALQQAAAISARFAAQPGAAANGYPGCFLAHRDYNTSRACEVAVSVAVAELELVRRTYRMRIESDIVELVNRAAPKKQIPIGDTKQK